MSLRDQLLDIYDRLGALTPDAVVDEARPEGSPLHGRFEWDDAIAGEAYRRQQAHELIQSVRIVYRKATGKEAARTVRGWHYIGPSNDYHPAEKVAGDPFLSQLVMADMEREWKQLKARYSHFKEFWQMVQGDASDKAA